MSDQCELFGLRSRITGAPARYPDLTTMAIKIRGSDAASADSDEMVSCIATRVFNGGPSRSIKDAVSYIARTQDIDHYELEQLDAIWTQRNDTFNFAFESPDTIKQAVNKALGAGFAEMTIKNGLLTPVRDAKRNPLLRAHSFSAQNTTRPITRLMDLSSGDETYGIDVEYLSEVTWRVETVRCRRAGLTGNKIEKLKVEGVTDRNKAWRIGMRELMAKRYQRQTLTAATELDALNASYNDLVFFVEDVPNYGQSALIVEQRPLGVYKVSEKIRWDSTSQVVAVLRGDDGRLGFVRDIERIDDYTFVATPWLGLAKPGQTVFFGVVERIGISAVVTDVKASGNGATITAVNYTDMKYEYDHQLADN